jgi:nucleotide-binding universal stress UspA family protein
MGTQTKRILLAIDGSDQAMDAIRYVGAFLPPTQTEVVLFHVAAEVPESFLDLGMDPSLAADILPISAWSRQVEKHIEEFMEKGSDVLIQAGFPRDRIGQRAQERKNGITRDILKEAEQGYDALVVGRAGVSNQENVVVGSVAHKLVNTIHKIPVAVVGGTPEPQNVLIGFDGSEGSMRGVDFVCSMLSGREIAIMLCLVVRSLGIHFGAELLFSAEHEDTWLRAISSQIESGYPEAENRLRDAGFHPDNVYLRVLENITSRAEGLTKAAETGGFGTIVLGRRGVSDVSGFTMGRVSRKVLHMADRVAVWIV